MYRNPDFIIIGAMKSATSTLHYQLELQNGIFMSEPKEPNFFSDDAEYARGVEWYNRLFDDAQSTDICGESSTHYTKLPTYPDTVTRIKDHLSQLKFVYVLRHPIDRLVSHYIHEWSQNKIKCDINIALDKHPELIEYGLYHKQVTPFVEVFGEKAILIVNFQEIVDNPQHVLEKVCRHIGYHAMPEWKFDEQPQNVSKQRIRKFPLYNILVNSNIAASLRRILVPQFVRDRIKNKFTMTHRPTLSDANLARLEKVFNTDLKQLSSLAGTELSCTNFTENRL